MSNKAYVVPIFRRCVFEMKGIPTCVIDDPIEPRDKLSCRIHIDRNEITLASHRPLLISPKAEVADVAPPPTTLFVVKFYGNREVLPLAGEQFNSLVFFKPLHVPKSRNLFIIWRWLQYRQIHVSR